MTAPAVTTVTISYDKNRICSSDATASIRTDPRICRGRDRARERADDELSMITPVLTQWQRYGVPSRSAPLVIQRQPICQDKIVN